MLKGEIERFVKAIFAECIQRHKYNVLEFETNKDHVHMLAEAADKKELSGIIRTLKSVSAKEIHGTPCFRTGNGSSGFHRRKPVEGRSSFWATRYGFREVGNNEIEYMREYIRDQKNIHIK